MTPGHGAGRRALSHLALQLRGFPAAAQGGSSLLLQHTLQGGTHCPASSHQQHRFPTCVTQEKVIQRLAAAQAPAPASAGPWSWSACVNLPFTSAPITKALRRASKAACNRAALCACTTSAAGAPRATLFEPMQQQKPQVLSCYLETL